MQPKITKHGLRLSSFYWARSQIWPQVGISIASGGLHITSTALSDINFLNTTKFDWARSHFGLRLASVLPQVVSALPQLLWVASIFWAQTYLAEHGLKLASGWHQHCLKWSLHYINCLEWHQFFEHGQIWLSTVSLWPQVGISIAPGGLRTASNALSDINFLSTTKFGWAQCLIWPQVGISWSSALRQVVTVGHQLALICWARWIMVFGQPKQIA